MSGGADRRSTRKLGRLLALSALLALAAVPAQGATSGGPDNLVIVSSSSDRPVAARSDLQVGSTGGTADTSTNLAQATSSDCTGCRASAAAFQVVFLTGEANYIAPANVATVTNASCNSCDTFAYAYQYVLTTHTPVYLDATAHDELTMLRGEIEATLSSGLSDTDRYAQLTTLKDELKTTIDEDLQRAGITPAAAEQRMRVAMGS